MSKPNYASLLAQIAAETDATAKAALEAQCYQFPEPLTAEEENLFNYVSTDYMEDTPGQYKTEALENVLENIQQKTQIVQQKKNKEGKMSLWDYDHRYTSETIKRSYPEAIILNDLPEDEALTIWRETVG